MQLALEVGMAKRIRRKLRMELENFDPNLLAEECMFEEEEIESGLGGSPGSFLSADSAAAAEMVAEKMRRNKTAGAKPLSVEDLAIQALTTEKIAAAASRSEPIFPGSTEPVVPRSLRPSRS